MTISCAWCGTQLSDDVTLTGESHGICADCEQVAFPPPSDPDGTPSPEGNAP